MVGAPLDLKPLTCGLAILISICCTGFAAGWRGDDGHTRRDVARDLPSPMEAQAEVSSGHSQQAARDVPADRNPPPHRQPSAYDILQHALWDEKMSDDAQGRDPDGYEADKWSHLRDGVHAGYAERTIDHLLRGIEAADADEHRGEGGHRLDGPSVQRRSSFPDTCGRRYSEPGVDKRVVLGRKARVGEWPWLVQLAEIGAAQPYCGGTLLSDKFVLTAAHCFDRHDPNDVVVIIGDRNRLVKEGTEQRFRVDCVYVHEAYVPRGDYKDDVALVRLKTSNRKVKMGPAVQPVCLPPQQRAGESDLFKSGDRCFVVGWGFTDPLTYFNSQHPAILHEARLPILPPSACRDAYGRLYTDNMVCAGHIAGDHRTDACKGDSGGPLMCRERTGHWVVWGIVSWGHNYFCNGSPDKPIPTVYTKVEEYLPWLRERLRVDQC